ncbi:MAG: amino acid adenylation domain-containing protein [Chitinophagaceae bacterium]
MRKENIQNIYPLSPLQEGFFFHGLNNKASGAYFIQVNYRLHGIMEPAYVQQALNMLAERYEVLRTSFVLQGLKKAYQVVLKERPPGFYFEDISDCADKDAYLQQARQKDKQRSFDLTHDPLMRVLLFKIAESEYEFIWSHHHIIMDGWCTGIVIREFRQIYESLQKGIKPLLPPVAQYGEFIKWLEKRDAQASAGYWNQYLQGYESRATIGLPDSKKPEGYDNCEVLAEIPADKFLQLQQLCARLKVTLNSLLQSAWAVLLSRYSGKNDVVFGMVVSLRPPEIKGVESMVGLLINTIPVRMKMNEDDSFETFVKQVQRNSLQSELHQEYPLADMQAATPLGNNLLDHVFVLGNYLVSEQMRGMEQEASEGTVRISNSRSDAQVNYDFSIYVSGGDSLRVCFNYNGLTYQKKFIEQIAGHYSAILSEIIASPATILKDIKILSETEEQQLTQTGRGPKRNYPGTIDTIFHEMAMLKPSAIAVNDENRSLTFAELDRHAASLALAIQDAEIERGSYIGVKVGRSIDTVISFLGILKAGCVYVPIEPDHPNERVANMLSAVSLKMLIITSEYLFDLPETEAKIFAIDLQLNVSQNEVRKCRGSNAGDTAYVIFTSGTTGQPKGIPVRHESIVDRSLYHIEYLGLNDTDAIMQLASVAFDASVIEMCMTLLAGAKLLIPPGRAKQDTELLNEYIIKNKVTVGIFPPAYLKLFNSEDLPGLRQIISTGEAAILKDMLAHAEHRQVHNGYGPTELCIGASFHTIDTNKKDYYLSSGNVPIGRAFSNTQVYVLDKSGRLCPQGVAGELCAAGIGVTNGYIGDEELTQQKFIRNPYCDEVGYDRLYRTGDLVQWNAQNELIYCGRIDEQVQVRGIRVELREIEAVLFRHSTINQACVLAHVHEGNTYLAAYVTTHHTVDTVELFQHLRSKLPEYMVPSQLFMLEKMPFTSNGKIDRQQLPAFDLAMAEVYEAPQNETETLLCNIWEEVLDRKPIGRQDNFFAIGGHSLKATQIISAVYRKLGIRLDIGEIFSHPRIALLAPVIDAQQGVAYAPIQEVIAADYPVTPSQRRLWVLHQLGAAATAYNISGSYELQGDLEVEALKTAFEKIVERHESLRTSFVLQGEALRQVINTKDKSTGSFEYIEVSGRNEIPALVTALNQHAFNLEEGNLLKVKLIRYAPDCFVLACVMHHIISDGWSIRRMLHELSEGYNNIVAGTETTLQPLKIQYRDYASWLVKELQNEQLSQARNYWISKLKNRIEPLQLVTDYPRPPVQTFNGGTENIFAGAELLQRVREFARQKEMSVFTVLLTAVKLLLFRYSNQTNITVGSIVSGREHPDVQDLIGCFINTVVFSVDVQSSGTVNALLEQVKQTTLGAYANQLYPFDQLVEEVEADRDLSRSALFDVLVNHQSIETSDEQVSLNGLSLQRYDTGASDTTSKFDLEFDFYEHTNELAVHLIYNTDLFRQNTIATFCTQFLHVLEDIIVHPSKKLFDVSLTGNNENNFSDAYSIGPVCGYDTTSGYSALFERQALQSPGAIAVEDASGKWTYAELMDHANRVCAVLEQKFSATHDPASKLVIAVCAERSRYLVALAVGIWKAGGIYMPVDPMLPLEPMRFILGDAGISLMITDKIIREIDVPQELAGLFLNNAYNTSPKPVRVTREDDGAYLLYTSGSTGRPKGVVVPATGMLNHMHSKADDLSLDKNSIVAQTATQSFDVSVWQMFAVLLCGGKVNIYDRLQVMELHNHIAELKTHGVTVVQMVPSYLYEFVEDLEKRQSGAELPALRYLVAAGEELTPVLAARFFRVLPHVRIANCYGPTEAADNISIHIMETCNGRDRVPVGRPLANTRLYVADTQGKLCPKGIVGEIWVSGPGVGKGYIGNATAISSNVFMNDPFTPGRRLYRTGDHGRWNADGVLEFHGRADRQVKLRGQRVELGEVERIIQAYADVKQCAVVFEADEPGGALSAYVTWKENSVPEERMRSLRSHLSAALASYMVPRHIVELAVLPLTPSGKIDRKKLPKQTAAKKKLLVPVNIAEERLLAIWRDLLKKEEISVEDNFFELGGHSLKAMRLLAAIEQTLGTRLKLQEIFKYPTIRGQAKLLETIDWIQQSNETDVPVSEEETVII